MTGQHAHASPGKLLRLASASFHFVLACGFAASAMLFAAFLPARAQSVEPIPVYGRLPPNQVPSYRNTLDPLTNRDMRILKDLIESCRVDEARSKIAAIDREAAEASFKYGLANNPQGPEAELLDYRAQAGVVLALCDKRAGNQTFSRDNVASNVRRRIEIANESIIACDRQAFVRARQRLVNYLNALSLQAGSAQAGGDVSRAQSLTLDVQAITSILAQMDSKDYFADCPPEPARVVSPQAPGQLIGPGPQSRPRVLASRAATPDSGAALIASLVPTLVGTKLATDGQAYCTFGTAAPLRTTFTPSDENGNPILPAAGDKPLPVAGDTPPPASGDKPLPVAGDTPPPASGDKPPPAAGDTPPPAAGDKPAPVVGGTPTPAPDPGAPVVQTGTDKDDTMLGTPGIDDIAGGLGKDEYVFTTNPFKPDDPKSTLTDGDTIRDYESKEAIVIIGVRLGHNNIKISYDAELDATFIEIDFTDPKTGKPDGKADKFIVLNGDKTGKLEINSNCCSTPTTEINIDLSKPSAPKAAEKSAPPPEVKENPTGIAPQETPSTATIATTTVISAGPVTLHIKATEAVLDGRENAGAAVKSTLVKLTPTEEPALPKPGAPRTVKATLDKGFDKSPVTCVTGADGQCKAQIAADERAVYGIPAGGGQHYRAGLTLDKNDGAVVEMLPVRSKADLPSVFDGANVTTSRFSIGDRKFVRVNIAGSDAAAAQVQAILRDIFGPNVQVDYCAEKKPGPPLGMEPISFSAPTRELPQGTIRLRRPGQPGAAR